VKLRAFRQELTEAFTDHLVPVLRLFAAGVLILVAFGLVNEDKVIEAFGFILASLALAELILIRRAVTK